MRLENLTKKEIYAPQERYDKRAYFDPNTLKVA